MLAVNYVIYGCSSSRATLGVLTLHDVPSFSIELLWLQRKSNKVDTILHDRYYLQNYKVITFEKVENHTKYKKPNVLSHLHIF